MSFRGGIIFWSPSAIAIGRVFLAGDAVHLVIPSGGLGMNTGVGDAFDLSWKLAGTIKGWGGPGLLDGYEQERRPIGVRNVAAAGWASEGVPIWRALVTPAVYEDTPEGEAKRRELAASFDVNHRRMHGMVGVEAGYSYAGSPLIADEPGNVAEWETSRYVPHARPGVRIPHMWLKDGRALQDVLGNDYTLLDLRGDCDAASAGGGVPRAGRTARRSPSGRGAGAFSLWRFGVPAAPGPSHRMARRWSAAGSRSPCGAGNRANSQASVAGRRRVSLHSTHLPNVTSVLSGLKRIKVKLGRVPGKRPELHRCSSALRTFAPRWPARSGAPGTARIGLAVPGLPETLRNNCLTVLAQ